MQVLRNKPAFVSVMFPMIWRLMKRIGFYGTAATDAGILFTITSDVLTRFELKLENCRGQCFDGASNMAGNISGLQKRISDVEPKALYVHCINHSLSLAFQDSISVIPQCRDAMNQIKDLITFVRESPKRLAWFTSCKDDSSKSWRRTTVSHALDYKNIKHTIGDG